MPINPGDPGPTVWANSVDAQLVALTPAWTAYTPVATAGAGTFITVTAVGRYTMVGKVVDFHFLVTETDIGTATGNLIVSLPVAANNTIDSVGIGREGAVTGVSFACITASPTTLYCYRYDNGATIGNGYSMLGSIRYEAA